MKKTRFTRKLKRLFGRTGKRFKKRGQLKGKKFKRNYGKSWKLKPHRERRHRKELHHNQISNLPTVTIGTINNATPNLRFTSIRVDPSVYANFIQGVNSAQYIGDTFNMKEIEVFFDIMPSDTAQVYEAGYSSVDIFRMFRIAVVETHDLSITLGEVMQFNAQAAPPTFHGPFDWKRCKVLYDKYFCNNAPLTFAALGEEALYQVDYRSCSTVNKRRHFHFRIPYKATLPVSTATNAPEVKKAIYVLMFSDITAPTLAINNAQWIATNILLRCYFYPVL